MRRVSVPLFMLGALVTAGCSVSNILAPSGAPAKIYMLSAPQEITTRAPQAKWQLLVAMPEAVLDLNSSRIAVSPAPSRMDYYADVVWADRPPAMLQELLLESFDRSGRIAAVQRQSGGLKADFILTSDIQDFQVEAGSGDATVNIRITARLVRTRDRTIVATRNFESRTPSGGSFDGAIAAFDGALKAVLPEIVDWTLTQGSANP